MRFPKPFFRESKQTWYVQIGKRQTSLGKDREEAFRRYKEIILHEEGKPAEPQQRLKVAEVCDLFLDWSSRHNDQRTYDWYNRFCRPAATPGADSTRRS
jgi:hypothetical protein